MDELSKLITNFTKLANKNSLFEKCKKKLKREKQDFFNISNITELMERKNIILTVILKNHNNQLHSIRVLCVVAMFGPLC